MGDFAEFYATRKDAVLRAVVAATGDRTGAEDAVAEAFTRAYARWARLAEHPSPTAWVTRAALNVYRSWWRRLRRERPTDELAAVAEPSGHEPDGTAGNDIDLNIRRLVAKLPRRQREVLALRVLADLSADEVAAVLGIESATVHVHLHRALSVLRRHMLARQPVPADDKSRAAMGEL
ncbi:MAG TPA: sigma-70 family RNA polymerase sigma factor [Micromonosporaceae bacterium]